VVTKISKFVKTGDKHLKTNKFCQDSAYCYKTEDFNLLCLSDGAGSYKYARMGSKLTCLYTIRFFKENISILENLSIEELKSLLITFIQSGILKYSKSKESSIDEFSSTLIFCLELKDQVIIGNIGDGLVIGVSNEEAHVLLEPKSSNEFDQTFFVTMTEAEKYLTLIKHQKKDICFILSTDGIADEIYNRQISDLDEEIKNIFLLLTERFTIYSEEDIKNDLEYITEQVIEKRSSRDDCSLGIMQISQNQNK
jgi:serine/threonine protein phosphatase PrpC